MISRPWSCDSFVALRDSTAGGWPIFGKNSDRPAGEAQPVRWVPARAAGGRLKLAYLEIDDADSFAHIGSAPFWCWGYEMGLNEKRVAIGNEALFSRIWAESVSESRAGREISEGLLGMELLRLGLERGDSARAALDVMTSLLELHGQWGSALFGAEHKDGSYDNSFLIADPTEAWVLETAGRHWVARRVVAGTVAISNEATIREQFDLSSPGIVELADSHGWSHSSRLPFDFAEAYSDPGTPRQVSHIRRRRAEQILSEGAAQGGVDLATARRLLRDHLEGTFLGPPSFDASCPDFHTLCMHEHPSGFTWGNTAASMIIELLPEEEGPCIVWWSASTPCTGAYIPLLIEAEGVPGATSLPAAPALFKHPIDVTQPVYDPDSSWWQLQNLLDIAKGQQDRGFVDRSAQIRARLDPLEREFEAGALRLAGAMRSGAADSEELRLFEDECVSRLGLEVSRLAASFGAEMSVPFDTRWRSERRTTG